MWKQHNQVIVALSGGKDSIALLYNLNKIQKERNNLKPVNALIINEGIDGYRNKSVKRATNFCDDLQINYKIISFKERVGKSLDKIIRIMKGKEKSRYSCNYCAILRRRLLNDGAKELNGDILAMGHNLTDIAETYLMNVFYKRFYLIGNQYLFRERSETIEKFFVKKITPLMEIPEEEIFLYCNLKKLNYYRSHCPYRKEDPIVRKRVLHFMQGLKKQVPNIEFNLLDGFLELSKLFYENLNELNDQKDYIFCSECGYPSTNADLCTYCAYVEKFS